MLHCTCNIILSILISLQCSLWAVAHSWVMSTKYSNKLWIYTHSAHIGKITVKSQMSHNNHKIQQKSKNVYNNLHVLIHQITVDVYNKWLKWLNENEYHEPLKQYWFFYTKKKGSGFPWQKKHPFQGDWSSFSKLSKHHVRAEQQQEEDTITALSSGCLWHATLRVNLSKCCCCQDEWNHSLVTDQTVSWSLLLSPLLCVFASRLCEEENVCQWVSREFWCFI